MDVCVNVDVKCVHMMNKRVDEFKHTLPHSNTPETEMHKRIQYTHTLKQLVRVPNQKRMISNDHCSVFHVAISLWALNIKDDYERAHMYTMCVCEWARECLYLYMRHTRNLYSGARSFSLRLSPSTVFKPQSCTRYECHNVAHLFNANTTLWVPYFWLSRLNLCAFFPGWSFFAFIFVYRPI